MTTTAPSAPSTTKRVNSLTSESETWTLPAYTKRDLDYQRAALQAAINHEERIGRNTGLLHAARRAVKAINEMLEIGAE